MKYTKYAVTIVASIAILIGAQSFTECRGDEGGTLSGTLIMDADSPICPPIDSGALTGKLIMDADSPICPPMSLGTVTGTSNLTFNGGILQTGTLSGAIVNNSSGFSLTKTGAGTLDLSGNNTYTGSTTVNNGTLQFNSSSSGTLQIGTGVTVSGATLGGSVGVINSGTNTISLSNNNSFTGATTIGAGTLQFIHPSLGTWQIGNGGIVSGATLNLGGSVGVINSGTINLAGSTGLMKIGTGTVTLSGNGTYTGPTIINGGTLQVSNTGSGILQFSNPGSDTLNMGTINIFHNLPSDLTIADTLNTTGLTAIQTGTLQISNSAILSGSTTNFTLNSGSALTKTGAGTLTLGGNTTYSGTTLVNSGTLQLGGISGSGDVTMVGSGTLTITHGIRTLQYGSINSPGGLTITSGAGEVILSSINTGTLTIGAGRTLTIAALPGGPDGSITPISTLNPIPRPSVMVMLSIAFLAFIGFGLRSKNSTVRP